MLAVRDFFILNPVWKLVKSLSVKDGAVGSGTWRPIKEVYIKDGGIGGGQWRKVYNNNVEGPADNAHPFWRFSLDPEFEVQDQISSNTLASDFYFTFWSTNNSGTYTINNGSARVNVNNIVTTFVPAVPATAGYYEYTEETRSIFCNFTNGSNSVVTFSDPGVGPVNRTGVDGISVPWTIRAFGYTRSGTTITGISSTNPPVQTFTMSQTAQASGTGITANLSRTYASNYVPPTSGTPAYYTHYGICRMISNYELAVSGGKTYRISTSSISGTINTDTRWGINAYTSNISGQAVPFGTNANAFQSPTYGNTTEQSFDITIPSGHNFFRVGLFVEHNSTTSTNSPPAIPQWGRFDYLRVRRIS